MNEAYSLMLLNVNYETKSLSLMWINLHNQDKNSPGLTLNFYVDPPSETANWFKRMIKLINSQIEVVSASSNLKKPKISKNASQSDSLKN